MCPQRYEFFNTFKHIGNDILQINLFFKNKIMYKMYCRIALQIYAKQQTTKQHEIVD